LVGGHVPRENKKRSFGKNRGTNPAAFRTQVTKPRNAKTAWKHRPVLFEKEVKSPWPKNNPRKGCKQNSLWKGRLWGIGFVAQTRKKGSGNGGKNGKIGADDVVGHPLHPPITESPGGEEKTSNQFSKETREFTESPLKRRNRAA